MNRHLPHPELLQLAGHSGGEFLDEPDVVRNLEVGDAVVAVGTDILFAELLAVLGAHPGHELPAATLSTTSTALSPQLGSWIWMILAGPSSSA